MNNCIEMLELISAYIDNEISESDKTALEAHLSTCESCSAALELYKEMSASISESAISAPESLCGSVMEKILSEKNDVKDSFVAESDSKDTENEKNKNNGIIYFKRYLPAVACLAVILLALPFALTLNNQAENDVAMPAGEAQPQGRVAFYSADYSAESQIAFPDAEAEAEADEEMAVAGGGAWGAHMPTPPADAPVDTQGNLYAPAPVAAPEPGEVSLRPMQDLPDEAPRDFEDESVQNEVFFALPSAEPPVDIGGMGAAASPPQADVFEVMEQEADVDDSRELMARMDDGTDLENILAFEELVRNSYVWIEIIGELPPMLRQYQSVQMDGWTVWEQMFRISREQAYELIEELRGQEGIVITQGDNSSEYAVVLFAASR